MIKFFWFIGSFTTAMMVCLMTWGFILHQSAPPVNQGFLSSETLLLETRLPRTNLTNAISGEPVTLTQASLSDAIVIILGGIGCSSNQVEILKQWKEYKKTTDSTEIEIMTLYADPLMGVEISRHEARILKRVSQVDFLTLVYEGEDFNPRAMKIRTPQVVRVQNGHIVEIYPQISSVGVGSL